MRILGKLILGKLVGVFALALLLLPGSYSVLIAASTTPIDLSSQVIVTTTNERTLLDPATGDLTLTADIDISNASPRAITAPLHAVIDVGNNSVSLPNALGGSTTSPYGKYYYDLSALLSSQTLAPGAQVRFALKIISRTPVRYGIHTYGAMAPASANSPPVAIPGSDRTVSVGSTVQLDGSRSSDADGNPLSYRWILLSTPAGGETTLSDPTAVKPNFRVLAAGAYVVQLVVNDGRVDSVPRTVTVTTGNAAPVANAGSDFTVTVGTVVELDGSRSKDPNDDPLQYHWWLVTAPEGSQATLDSASKERPTFTPDRIGTYVARLMVSDGQTRSVPVKVVISTVNSIPRAHAGSDRIAPVGEGLTLVGTRSKDADGQALSYRWALLTKPGTSQALLTAATTTKPMFTPDRAGTYVLQLMVHDGTASSAPATITLEAVIIDTDKDGLSDVEERALGTHPKKQDTDGDGISDYDEINVYHSDPLKKDKGPRLEPIANQTVEVGKTLTAQLITTYPDKKDKGKDKKDNDDPLTYTVQPLPANASLNEATGLFTFTPVNSQAGTHTLTFKVSDGKHSSAPDSNQAALITVAPNLPPVLAAPGDYTVRVGQPLAFTLVATDPEADALTYAVQPLPANASLNAVTGAFSFTPTAAQAGTLTLSFSASDGFARSTPGSSIQSATLTIKTDTPPVLTPIPDQIVKVGATLSFTLSATDSDGDPVTYAATNLPANASLDASSGVFTFNPSLAQAGRVTVAFTASDGRWSDTQTANITVEAPTNGLPPDPATVAPPVDPTVSTTVFAATQFLYTGANPIQTGVAPGGTIEAKRAAVLRGKVLARDNTPLSGVQITILNHPEFGQTLSRTDGMFDLAVNGGGYLTINYIKTGYLPAQRQINTPWQDYAALPDVVLIPVDTQVTSIDLTAATPIQAAQGSIVTDQDGTRRATILFPQGTTAQMVLPDGSTQALTTLNVRATEYTVGPNGPQAMPASLPPTSGYTYAVELSVDEAIAAGAKTVTFSQSVPVYVDNFLNFPVGGIVPAGYYDRDKAAWIPAPNGRVIKVLSITGGLAELDTNGDGLADDATQLAALNISDAERQQLASLYAPGASLWRVPVSHFTPWDYNWPFGPPPDATPPNQPPPDIDKKEDKPTCEGGSIIECQNQTLGERIGVTGTPFDLNYRSDRVPGRKANIINIRLSGASVPASLKRIELAISVAGRRFIQTFPAAPNQSYLFTWDGKDVYNRLPQGSRPVTINIGYVYEAVYQQPWQFAQSFGVASGSSLSRGARQEITIWQELRNVIDGIRDVRSQGLGGWTATIHHYYDPHGQILGMGDGTRRSVQSINSVITTVVGNGASGFSGDGGTATAASLYGPSGVTIDSQGNLFIADFANHRIRKVNPAGIITTVAGIGAVGFRGDGGSATAAVLYFPRGVTIDPQGNLFIADYASGRIRKVSPAGIITTVAGSGMYGFSGDGGQATAASLYYPVDVTVDPQGNLFIADTFNHRIRKVGQDGIITTVAGNGASGFSGDDGIATAASLSYPYGITIDPQGNLFIADYGNHRIRKVSPAGIITTMVGNGTAGFEGDGGIAIAAKLYYPYDVAVSPQGSLFVADNNRIRKVDPVGIITTVAGNFNPGFSGDNGAATGANLSGPTGVTIDPQGNLFIADVINNRIRKVALPLPGFDGSDLLIPSEDGTQLYHFSDTGRHLRTLNTKTQAVLYSFTYDSKGLLTAITDTDSNITRIERDAAGSPLAIVSSDNQRTTLTLDANGYLASIANPAGKAFQMIYTVDGLLTAFADPKGNASLMTYDALGRLTRDQNAAGGFWALARTELANGYEARMTSAENRTTTYRVENLSTGDKRRTNLFPDGTQTTSLIQTNGTTVDTAPDGTITTTVEGPDPRFGMQAPITQSFRVKAPSGLTLTTTATRSATLSNPDNKLSLLTQTDTLAVNGKTFTSIYDAALSQTTLTSPLNRRSLVKTDAQGRVLQEQTASLEPLNYQYDTRGRLSSITHGTVGSATARTATLSYDAQGNLANLTDPLGRLTSYQYDLAARLTQQTLPDGRIISYTYDANGNVTSITPPGRSNHAFAYTPVDLEQQYTPPAAGLPTPQTSYTYNLDKQLTRITRPDGQLVDLAYDSGGRLASLIPTPATAGPGINYAYDPAGRLQTLSIPGGAALNYTYDGALPRSESLTGPINGTITRAYTNDFNLSSLSVNGTSIPFAYDNDGLLIQAGSLTLSRDAQHGLLTGTTLGATTTGQSYTGFGEITQLTALHAGSPLLDVQYTRDNAGRITQKVETLTGQTDTYSYTYDQAGRLTAVTKNGVSTATYSYDPNGNRQSKTDASGTVSATSDDQDRLLSYGVNTYSYTANGERNTQTSTGQTTSYTYDVFGNLTKATLPNATTVEYLIDGRNRRIGKKINGTLTQGFLYQDQLKPIAELDGTGNIVSRFVYATGINVPDYIIKGATTYRIITDHLGSPRLIVNTADGTIAQRLDYDEFGNVITDTNPGLQPFGFAGGIYDRDTQLTRFGGRDYDAETGKWTAKDPIRFEGGDVNLYTYVENDPVNWIDPEGLAAEHNQNKRESNREIHEKGQARKNQDQGGEKGDKNRADPRKKPNGWTGPWPRKIPSLPALICPLCPFVLDSPPLPSC
jgi:RHS repeat-associated protein